MEKLKFIVRLRTNVYIGKGGIAHYQKSMTLLKKLSTGTLEDIIIDPIIDIPSIINLNNIPDGVYQLIPVNEQRDWESGLVDDYDLALIPYRRIKSNTEG